ncbi:radical SAM family protein [Flavilitoribacter nigricans]|uniref:Radical SAM protein n=1 Tax=Flavilitoribacter nigricans (strain ATCC 23147 / DSM 23189 / NBRC 102662 / NCIMB 1420 / SS-2) TaxID=1122177 RepID=A0A2D0N6S4_FLAN2|nr:hypothetical protein [Flavilitoribacter nigricans]PHN04098.1 hypothetical protein CRP01_23155 [Flavilitoribacter nigricans DSM 23189 = NBRC 102662]
MKTTQTLRNLRLRPDDQQELAALRSGKWLLYETVASEQVNIGKRTWSLRSGLTFTPYANPTRCNAHCRFCSEELQRKHQKQLTALQLITDHDRYFSALSAVLADLAGLKNLGLSLSGLEATSDPFWLVRLLQLLQSQQGIPRFNERVLYTNGSGLHRSPDLIFLLQDLAFDRLEISRCHYKERINQRIMYINRNQAVWQNVAYEELIRKVNGRLPVKSSCILTKPGVNDVNEMEKYLDWQLSLGVSQVVFRELSRLDDTYIENSTKQWVEDNRVPIDGLLRTIMPDLNRQRRNWTYLGSTAGYYYYNERYRYKNTLEVNLETSSYRALMDCNETSLVQKLVFHSNGNLCGDWDPNEQVMANYFQEIESGMDVGLLT